MKAISRSQIVSIGLAIFSMLFGAGNLMYPLMVGMTSGTHNLYGMIGFTITAILLPLAGLIAMILFNGDYKAFFYRLGLGVGGAVIFCSIIVIGPLIAIPRIVTLSHLMIAPFLGIPFLQTMSMQSSFVFALLFLGITFLATARENRIVDLLGYVISPLLLLSLIVIMFKGFCLAQTSVGTFISPFEAFKINLIRGYETLDLLGTIFFSSVVIHILQNNFGGSTGYSRKSLALLGFKAGGIGVGLLALVYIGMSFLGVFHGHGFENANAGELFRLISFEVLGHSGAIIISIAVLMACLSTSIALCAVFAEYIQHDLCRNRIGYVSALLLAIAACLPLSTFGLNHVLTLAAGPLVYIGYPIIIAITLCNIAYKVIDFKPIKMPVLITFILATISYFM